ncbi:MAG: ABC transporter permease [Planctomycetes bacterium]|nr:ABC transporter permease [Planctomycetota bacterium]
MKLLRNSVLELILVALFLILAISAPYFLTVENILNILRNASMQGIIAMGMTLVIIAGEIDLSVGSAVAFAGCLTAWLNKALKGSALDSGEVGNIIVAACIAIIAGTMVGFITGWLRVRFSVPTFIITLASLTILKGAAQLITNGFPISSFPRWFNFFGGGYIFADIPFPAVIFIAVFIIISFITKYTSFGRSIYATGGNLEAARLSGIRVRRVKIAVMAILSGLSAVAGIMQASQIMSGSANTATGWELDVIASVIIGGTSLAGGAGTVWGTFIGILFLGVLVNGMTLLNINEYWQFVVRGFLILLAVLINMAPANKK